MISRLKQPHWKLQATGGFSLIEMVIVILAIGIFGSLAATMLANGATIYAKTMEKKIEKRLLRDNETKNQKFPR